MAAYHGKMPAFPPPGQSRKPFYFCFRRFFSQESPLGVVLECLHRELLIRPMPFDLEFSSAVALWSFADLVKLLRVRCFLLP